MTNFDVRPVLMRNWQYNFVLFLQCGIFILFDFDCLSLKKIPSFLTVLVSLTVR